MTSQDNTDRGAYVALGALFGAAAGVITGLLMAPQSGVETRRKLRDQAANTTDQARQQFSEKRDMAVQKLNSSLDRSKNLVNKVSDKTKEMVDKTAKRANDAATIAQNETEEKRRNGII